MSKQSHRRKSSSILVRARETNARLEIAKARFEMRTLRNVEKAQQAMLSTYAAADRGRRNKDWRASTASADLAIISDQPTLIARARQMERDTWAGKSIVRAFVRNVVGNGIIPIPQARDAGGNLLADLNKKALGLFWAWANDASACDAAREQTFWTMQALAERERVIAGQAFVVWSYAPYHRPDGSLDLRRPVGLKMQMFETEQLDRNMTTHEGREVRGGIEIDDFGGAVAYHVYRRNPNDYMLPPFDSVRIPAERVLRYKKKERVGSTHGVTDLAAVMQDIRDLGRVKDANLWRMIMEACIGLIVKQNNPAGGTGSYNMGMLPQAGGSDATGSGMPLTDMTPGMIAHLKPNEDVTALVPQAPGNQYDPFTQSVKRGIAAGAGVGFGQFTMDFTQGTYSGQRQEMLETRKEFEPLQELLAHSLVLPVWRLFYSLAILEGRLDVPDFAEDPARYTEAEYVAPPQPWIDPEKEMNAWTKAIEQRVMDREEIAAMRGMRLLDVWDRLERESVEAKSRNLDLPEESVDTPATDPAAAAESASLAFKRHIVGAFIADGTIADVIANATNIGKLLEESGLPRQAGYVEPWLPVQADPSTALVGGEVVKDAEGDIVGGGVVMEGVQKSAVSEDDKVKAEEGEARKPNDESSPKPETVNPAEVGALSRKAGLGSIVVDGAPSYRPAETEAVRCATCRYLAKGQCVAYEFACAADHVCEAWEAPPISASGEAAGNFKIVETPTVPDGERPMDDVRSAFNDRAARGVE